MTNVERYPQFYWGDWLEVDRTPECLLVSGCLPGLATAALSHHSWDLVADYRKAPKDWSAGRTAKKSPHIWFANADTDEKLIAFVKRYGPVVVSALSEQADEHPLNVEEDRAPTYVVARQEMTELRNERSLYRSALTLLSELERETLADTEVVRECIANIADRVGDWPRQWIRERDLRIVNSELRAQWQFGKEAVQCIENWKFLALRERPKTRWAAVLPIGDPIQAGHKVICELVNAFQPRVYVWGKTPIEGPHWDVRYGIRPLLFYLLRQQYLAHGGIAVCANVQCRELFEIERAGNRFCTDTCSQHQRQREYWVRKGKKLRTKRWKKKKANEKLSKTGG